MPKSNPPPMPAGPPMPWVLVTESIVDKGKSDGLSEFSPFSGQRM